MVGFIYILFFSHGFISMIIWSWDLNHGLTYWWPYFHPHCTSKFNFMNSPLQKNPYVMILNFLQVLFTMMVGFMYIFLSFFLFFFDGLISMIIWSWQKKKKKDQCAFFCAFQLLNHNNSNAVVHKRRYVGLKPSYHVLLEGFRCL